MVRQAMRDCLSHSEYLKSWRHRRRRRRDFLRKAKRLLRVSNADLLTLWANEATMDLSGHPGQGEPTGRG